MQTQTKTTEYKRRNIPLVKFGLNHNLPEIEGIYLKLRDAGESIDETSGEVRKRETVILQKVGSDEKFQIWANAGLKNALSMADVQEGEQLKIVHLGKVERAGKVGTVNQYDIFTLN